MRIKNKDQVFFTVLATLTAALLIGFFAVVLPLALTEDAPPAGSVNPEGGEGQYGQALTLFGPFARQELKEIEIHGENGSYSFVQQTSSSGTPLLTFRVEKDGTLYESLVPNDEKLASIVVAAGMPSVRPRLLSENITEETLAEYGLSAADDPSYYTLTLFDGSRYKVYVGDMTADKNGYFIRLEGRDAVYVTLSPYLGDLVKAPVGDYFTATILPPAKTDYTYYFAKDFAIQSENRDYGKNADGSLSGRVVTENDTVLVKVRVEVSIDGVSRPAVESERLFILPEPQATAEQKARLIGQTVGAPLSVSPIVREDLLPSTDGGEVLRRETMTFLEIVYASERKTDIAFDFIKDANDRDYFKSAALYQVTGPSHALNYTANDNYIMQVLPALASLSGDRVVEIGAFEDGELREELLQKYGLHRYTVSLLYPTDYKITEVVPDAASFMQANTITIKDEDYIPLVLYISERQKDGTYYVASSYYDTVAVVPGDNLGFLDNSLSTWLAQDVISAYLDLLKGLRLDFAYSDFSGTFDYDLTSIVEEKDAFDKAYRDRLLLNGAYTDYKNLEATYFYLLWQDYLGETGLSAEETAAVTAKTPEITLTVSLTDGRVYTYRFYTYSDRRVLVSLSSDSDPSSGSHAFYISTTVTRTLANAYRAFFEDGTPVELSRS